MRHLIILSMLVGLLAAHSWMACADYASVSDTDWDHTKCRGYGRNAKTQCSAAGTDDLASFGKECSMANNKVPGCHSARTDPVSSAYSTTYPQATYYQGQYVCLAWPAKNHVAANCGPSNQYIPDNGIKLFYSAVNPTSDPSQADFNKNEITPFGNGVHASGTVDYKGFQNCSNFCNNPGNAFCSGCFTIPSDMAVGSYTFQWAWFFNSADDSYYTCADVEVKASTDAPSGVNADGSSVDGSSSSSSGSGGVSKGGGIAIAVIVIVAVVAAVVGGMFFIYKKKPLLWDAMKLKASMTMDKVRG